jgi:DNA-binding NarL/FixJ family response regulator
MCAEKPTRCSKALTLRQREVLQLLVNGSTMRQAAGALGITTRTIAYNKYHVMEQFHLATNTNLVRFAIKERLVPQLGRRRTK